MKRTVLFALLALCCFCSCQKLTEKTTPRNRRGLSALAYNCIYPSVNVPLALINQGLSGKDSALFMTKGSLIPAEYASQYDNIKGYALIECLLPGSWRVTENPDAPFGVYGNVSFVNVIMLEQEGQQMHYRCMVNAEMNDRNGYVARLGGTVDGIEAVMEKGSPAAEKRGSLYFNTFFDGEMLDDAAISFTGSSTEFIFKTLDENK